MANQLTPEAEVLRQQLNQRPANEVFYEHSLSLGNIDESGRQTARGIGMQSARAPQEMVLAGKARDDDNLIKATWDGLRRTAMDVTAGIAQSVGQEDLSESIRHNIEMNKELAPKQFKETPFQWIADSLGMVGGEIAGPAIATAAAGPGAGISFAYARRFGDAVKTVEGLNPNLSVGETLALSIGLAGASTAIEYAGVGGMGSLEARLGQQVKGTALKKALGVTTKADELLLNNKLMMSMRGFMQKAKSEAFDSGAVSKMAKEYLDPTNPLSGAVKGAAGEYFEESAEALLNIFYESRLGGVEHSSEELANRLFVQPMAAIPAGGLLGAFAFTKATADSVGSVEGRSAEETLIEFGKPDGTIDLEAIEKEEMVFQAFGAQVADVLGAERAATLTQTVKALSWSMTKTARANGDTGAVATQFVGMFNTAFINTTLSPESTQALFDVINDETIPVPMRTDKVIKTLGQLLGTESEIYKTMRDGQQELQANMLDDMAGKVRSSETLRKLPNFNDKKAKQAFVSNIQGKLGKLFGEDVAEAVAAGKNVSLQIEGISRDDLSWETYARLTTSPQVIKIGKVKVRISAGDGKITVRKEAEVKKQEKAEGKEAVATEAEIRTGDEGAPTTASDSRLATARQEAFKAFSEYVNVDEESELYKARAGLGGPIKPIIDDVPVYSQRKQAAEVLSKTEEMLAALPEEVAKPFIEWNKANPNQVVMPVSSMLDPVAEQATTIEEAQAQAIESPQGFFAQAQEARTKAEEARIAENAKTEQEGRVTRRAEAEESVVIQERIAKRVGISDKYATQLEQDIKFRTNNAELLAEIHDAIEANDLDRVKTSLNRFEKVAKKRIKELKKQGSRRGPLGSFIVAEEGAPVALGSGIESQLNGLYIPETRTAIFFANADESTVLHEWLHHVRSLLPEGVQNTVLDAIGTDAEKSKGVWGVHAEEKFVDDILIYLRDGNLTGSDEYADAIRDTTGILKGINSLKAGSLSDATREALDGLFADVTASDLHGIDAQTAANNMDTDLPTVEQVREAQVLASMEDEMPTNGSRAANNSRLWKIAGGVFKGDRDAKHALVRDAVMEVVPWFTEESRMSGLSAIELRDVANYIFAQSKPKKTTIEPTNVKEEVELLVKANGTKFNKPQERRRKYSTRKASLWNTIRNGVYAAIDKGDTGFTNIPHLTTLLDDGTNYGAHRRVITNPIFGDETGEGSRSRTAGWQQNFADIRHEAMKKFGLADNAVATKRVEGSVYNVGELVLLDLANKQVGDDGTRSKSALMESNGVTEEDFAFASQYVASHADAKSYQDYFTFVMKKAYDPLAAEYKKVTGKKLGWIANYFPMLRSNEMWGDEFMQKLERVGDGTQANMISGKDPRMTKKRDADAGGYIQLGNSEALLDGYISSAATYIGSATTVKDVMSVLGDKGWQDSMRQAYGKERGESLITLAQDLVSRELIPNARQTPRQWGDSFLAQTRTTFTFVSLVGRPLVVALQAVSKLSAYSMFKGGVGPSTLLTDMKNTIAVTNAIRQNSNINIKRAVNGEYKTKGYQHWVEGTRLLWTDSDGTRHGLWADHAQHILNSMGNPITGDVVTHGHTGMWATKVKGVAIGDMALNGIQIVDMQTVSSVWLTLYDSVFDAEMQKHGDPVKAENKAASEANYNIAKTQPPRSQHDRPQALTRSEGFRSLFPFSGQTMQLWQMWVNDVVRPLNNIIKTGDWSKLVSGTEYESGLGKRLLIGFAIPALFLGAKARRRPPTKEEALQDILIYPWATMPGLGGVIQYTLQNETNYAEIELAHLRLVNQTIDLLGDVSMAVKGEKFNRKEWKNLGEVSAYSLKIPTIAIPITEELIKGFTDPNYKTDRDSFRRALKLEPSPLPTED